MHNLQPRQNCHLDCPYRENEMCVCNLVSIDGSHAPISLGLRIGLDHIYGPDCVPLCVHGPVGASYWAIDGPAA